MVASLAGFAAIHLAKREFEQAAILYGCVENQIQRTGSPFLFTDTVEYERCVSQLRQELDEKALSVAWSKGRAMPLEQGIEVALKEIHT